MVDHKIHFCYNTCMNKLIISLLAVLVTGCATYSTPPEAVAVMPDDCANQRAIESYLIGQIQIDKPNLMSEEDYASTQSYYKRALWQLRYNCNPAS